MPNTIPKHLTSIAAYHLFWSLPPPEHPLISVVNFADLRRPGAGIPTRFVQDFYSIALKRPENVKLKYGQQHYDFDSGMMAFIAPGQYYAIEYEKNPIHSGWLLLVHPDFLWSSTLAKTIKNFEFFNYAIHEALHLSPSEETVITDTIFNIQKEYHANIDAFSQNIIISQIELLLHYCDRFYHRQFLTRRQASNALLEQFEELLTEYFDTENLIETGLPKVQDIADRLNVSAGYLSSMLRIVTGRSAQDHIHEKLIEKAKARLAISPLTVSEIAYELGFQHTQSFSKLFKSKTDTSPRDFRKNLN